MGRDNFWGKLIVNLRAEQKLSQRQLAERAHVNRSTLRRIESGRSRGDIGVMEALLNCLGYELEAFTSESVEQRLLRRLNNQKTNDPESKLALASLLSFTTMEDSLQPVAVRA